MRRQALQVAAENAETLLKGKFNFSPQKILNKTILFDTSRINEEQVMDETLETLSGDNDELCFTRARHKRIYSKTGRWKVNKKCC